MVAKKWDNVETIELTTATSAEYINLRKSIDTDPPISIFLLRRNLLFFIVLKTIGSFDSGAFSAALGAANGIAEEWNLSSVHQGALSSSVFLGNIVGCILSGNLFSRYSAKKVLFWSLIFHSLFTFFFTSSTNYGMILFFRFLIGVTLSFVVVYTPLWVDAFAPHDRQSVWMASHNVGVPLGIMLGYVSGALLPLYINVNWVWAFYIKCIFTVPVVVYLVRVDSCSIDQRSVDGVDSFLLLPETTPRQFWNSDIVRRSFVFFHDNFIYSWRTFVLLLYNIEFMSSMLAMCFLYFVASALQNFLTQYLRDEPFNASMNTILVGFSTAVVLAPVLGVITGGVLLDRIGGYQRNLRRVTLFTCFWGVAAAFLSILCIFITDTTTFLLVISALLFCGGATIAPTSGTVVASLSEQLRPTGAAFAQMMYNLLGNFSGPMICGLVAEWTGELRYGIFTTFSFAVCGIFPMFVLFWRAHSVGEKHDFSSSISSLVNVELAGNNNNNNGEGMVNGKLRIITTEMTTMVGLESNDSGNGGGAF